MSQTTLKARHYTGTLWWGCQGVGFYEGSTDAIYRKDKNELALDLEAGGHKYTITLKANSSGMSTGTWHLKPSKSGNASCKLIPDNEDLYLFGSWDEEGSTFQWFGTLEPADPPES